MSLVTPHALATSSMEVWANPDDANARAAPWRMAARRSLGASSLLSICIPSVQYILEELTRMRPNGEPPWARLQVQFTEEELLAD
jgi:hypothetical protein